MKNEKLELVKQAMIDANKKKVRDTFERIVKENPIEAGIKKIKKSQIEREE